MFTYKCCIIVPINLISLLSVQKAAFLFLFTAYKMTLLFVNWLNRLITIKSIIIINIITRIRIYIFTQLIWLFSLNPITMQRFRVFSWPVKWFLLFNFILLLIKIILWSHILTLWKIFWIKEMMNVFVFHINF